MDGDLERQVSGTKDMVPQAQASLVARMVKNLPAMRETRAQSLGWEDPLEKGMTIHSSGVPREFHGQRSLACYSPCSFITANVLAMHRECIFW